MIRVTELGETELLLNSLGVACVGGGPRSRVAPVHAALPLQENAVLLVQSVIVAVHGSQGTHLRVVREVFQGLSGVQIGRLL